MAAEDQLVNRHLVLSLLDVADKLCAIRAQLDSPYRESLGEAVCHVLEALSGVSTELTVLENETADFGDEPVGFDQGWQSLPAFLSKCRDAMQDPMKIPGTEIHVRAFTYRCVCSETRIEGDDRIDS